MEEQIVEALRELAKQLGVTTNYLWKVLVKQQYVNIIIYFIVSGILSIASILLHFIGYKGIILKLSDEHGSYDELSDRQFWINAYRIGQLVIYITIIVLFILAIMRYTNPEYYALQEILGLL